MKKIFLIIVVVLLCFCSGCLNDPAEQQESLTPLVSSEPVNDMEALRKDYFDFAIENRLDYVPLFKEGEAPTQSEEYLYYAFIINLDNWGDDKGIMTKDYVEQVIQTHFEVDSVTHGPMERGWDYDGEKYIAHPSGVNEEPIYVLKTYDTYTKDQRTIFEITMDRCSFGGVIPTPEDMHNIKKSIASGDLSALTTLQTERFQYYLDPNTDAVVFLSHTLTTPLSAEELEYFNGDDATEKLADSEKLLSFIEAYDEKTRMLSFDEIEWVMQTDTGRVSELGLDAELDFPNGFYIYNENDQTNRLKVAEDAKVYLVNWNDLANPTVTDVNGLTERMAECQTPYYLTIKDGVIVEILEQYVP